MVNSNAGNYYMGRKKSGREKRDKKLKTEVNTVNHAYVDLYNLTAIFLQLA